MIRVISNRNTLGGAVFDFSSVFRELPSPFGCGEGPPRRTPGKAVGVSVALCGPDNPTNTQRQPGGEVNPPFYISPLPCALGFRFRFTSHDF
jgi:hypothetical protein